MGVTGEPCGIPESTGRLTRRLPSIMISMFRSERKLAIHCIWSPSIPLVINVWTSLALPTVGKDAPMSIRRTPATLPALQVACALSTMIAAASIANHLFLLPLWPSLSTHLLSASSASSSDRFFNRLPYAAQQGDGEVSLEFRVVVLRWLVDYDSSRPLPDCWVSALPDGCIAQLHISVFVVH